AWWAIPGPERPTLADRLQSGPLPTFQALKVAAAIGDALSAVHATGIVLGALSAADVGLAHCTVPGWVGGPIDGSMDPRSDVYRLGVLWFSAMTGMAPNADADLSLIRLAGLDPLVEDEAYELLSAMLDPNPDRRPYPFGPIVDRLRDLAATCTFSAVPPLPYPNTGTEAA
ncbi:MAG: hypothetical protein ABMB14_17300, partial [Myxococcota bacterium]